MKRSGSNSKAATLIAATLTALVLPLLSAPSADASPTWVDPGDVNDTGDQITQLQVVSMPSSGPGGSGLVWVDAATDDLVGTFRADGGSWAAPIVLASPTATPHIDTVRAQSTGHGAEVEVTYSSGSTLSSVTEAVSESGALTVSAPVTVSSTYVAGTASESGDTLVWAEEVGGGQQRLVNIYNNEVEVLQPPAAVTYRATSGALDTDSSENETPYIAYVTETAGGDQQLYLMIRGHEPKPLGRAGSTFADMSFHSSGNLAWVETPASGPTQVRVALATISGTVTTVDVPGGPGVPSEPSVAKLAGSGRVLVWREQDGATWSIRTSTAPPTSGAWTAPTTLDSGTGTLPDDHYAAASSARGQVVSWCRPDGASCSVKGAFRAGKSWRPVTTLGTVATAADAHLARPAAPAFSGYQDAPATAWTDGGDDVRVAAIDYVGPTTHLDQIPVATFGGTFTARWSAVDDWSAVSSYQFETAIGNPHGDVGPWSVAAPSTVKQRKLPVTNGRTRCVRIRATDAVINTGDFSSRLCTVAPLDDRDLRRSKGWTRVHDTASFDDTLLRSTRRGATVALRNYPFDKVLIFVHRVPNGGKVEVLLDGHRLRTLSTAGTDREMVALPAPALSSNLSLSHKMRDLRIRVITNGKPVLIDGVFVGSELPTAKQVNLLTR